MLRNYIEAEHIKGKRSFSHFLIIIYPLLVTLLGIPFSIFIYSDTKYFVALVYNWFPTMFLPLGLILASYLSVKREIDSSSSNYYPLLDKQSFWKSKIIVLSIYSLCLNLSLAIFTISFQLIMYQLSQVIILDVLFSSLILWLSTLFIIPLTLLLSIYFTPFIGIIFNLTGLTMGIFFAMGSKWFLVPWSYGVRLITPIIKVNPNGTFLQNSSSLNTFVYLPFGVGIAIIIYLILTLFLVKIKKRQIE